MSSNIPTIFCDIDGTLIEMEEDFPLMIQGNPLGRDLTVNFTYPPDLSEGPLKKYTYTDTYFRQYKTTKGSVKKIFDWHIKGYKVILVTGRPECTREFTEKQLQGLGIVYDMLIMGVGSGPRYLINDRDGNGFDKAFGINLDRNTGIGDIVI